MLFELGLLLGLCLQLFVMLLGLSPRTYILTYDLLSRCSIYRGIPFCSLKSTRLRLSYSHHHIVARINVRLHRLIGRLLPHRTHIPKYSHTYNSTGTIFAWNYNERKSALPL